MTEQQIYEMHAMLKAAEAEMASDAQTQSPVSAPPVAHGGGSGSRGKGKGPVGNPAPTVAQLAKEGYTLLKKLHPTVTAKKMEWLEATATPELAAALQGGTNYTMETLTSKPFVEAVVATNDDKKINAFARAITGQQFNAKSKGSAAADKVVYGDNFKAPITALNGLVSHIQKTNPEALPKAQEAGQRRVRKRVTRPRR